MALRLAGEKTGIHEKTESIDYNPALQDTGDMESGTKAITATSKQVSPDYSSSQTIASPGDTRLKVHKVGLRLAFTIDSMTAGTLNYAVDVAGTERLTGSVTTTGAKLDVVTLDVDAGEFTLGSAQSIEVFFWVDAGDAVLSVCQVWLGVGFGYKSGGSAYDHPISLTFNGMVVVTVAHKVEGTGGVDYYFCMRPGQKDTLSGYVLVRTWYSLLLTGQHYWEFTATVANDLIYLRNLAFVLRSLR